MIRYEIQKRDWSTGKWSTVKVFLKRNLAENYMKQKKKQDYRIFGE